MVRDCQVVERKERRNGKRKGRKWEEAKYGKRWAIGVEM
jgi:hypothetical protein